MAPTRSASCCLHTDQGDGAPAGAAASAGDAGAARGASAGGGTLDGVRIIGPKTLELMASNHLPNGDDLTQWARGTFSETNNEGYGFGLGFSVNLGPGRTSSAGSAGEIAWGGAASTIFWVDPAEDLAVILMTQFMPSGTFNFRGQMKALVYPAIEAG